MTQDDIREEIFIRAEWRCELCGKPLTSPDSKPQLGHIIPQRKVYLKKYGKEIIHHPLNMKACCSEKCNNYYDLGYKTELIEKKALEIRKSIDIQSD